jgi:hypothetical protein
MKLGKTFIFAFVLGLAGVVYAAGGPQGSTNSWAIHQADCCAAGASCCTGGACCAAHQSE